MDLDYLLEIGLEELPYGEIERIETQLKTLFMENLWRNRIDFNEVKTYSTGRRLIVVVHDISSQQKDMEAEKRGPSTTIAYDSKGNPTKALIGFAKANGVEISDIFVKNSNNGAYCFAKKLIRGKKTAEVLKEIVPNVLSKLQFKRAMRWGNGSSRFIRPIHWIVSILGDKVVNFDFASILSSNSSEGHRSLCKKLEIDSVSKYFDRIKDFNIVISYEDRKDRISSMIKKIEKENGIKCEEDERLLDELARITEYPTPFIAHFDTDFLTLPPEVLRVVLREQQKCFVTHSPGNSFTNAFVGVMDTPFYSRINDTVIRGYERVVRARLDDAKFYYEQDIKIPLEKRNEKLKGMIFQAELGTLYDKIKRVSALALYLCKILNISEDLTKKIERAALLSKADLATQMVYEFPSLQGIMGGIYALVQGEDEEVANAIKEHYKPNSFDDILPSTLAGSVLSICDKVDTVVSHFCIGNISTGSSDPYGLRKRVNGILRMIIDREFDIDLRLLFEQVQRSLPTCQGDVLKHLERFVKTRFEVLLKEKGFTYDVVNSALYHWQYPLRVVKIAQAITSFRQTNEFEDLAIGYTRAANITREHKYTEFDVDLFTAEEEHELHKVTQKVQEQVKRSVEKNDYTSAIRSLMTLRPYIDRYFDEVLVMCEDKRIRDNRLGFLRNIVELFHTVGDLSEIVAESKK